jgi:putative peptide zinc metalloprotease protein
MNLAEALNVALPELPRVATAHKRLPKVDPTLIVKEQTQDGVPMVMVLIPSTRRYYPMTYEQWDLLSLFDGTRTYDEIAAIHTSRTSVLYTADHVREYAEALAGTPLWYRTPQEQNIALWEKLKEERRHRSQTRSRFGNLAEITFSAWDPNKFLTKAHEKLRWLFTPGFLVFNALLLGFTAYIWIDRWGEIGRDSLEYYTFTHKGFTDIVEFWVLIFFAGLLHETSHGLCCKHTGGEVHRMGFLLIYLSPCFFCDTTEAWVFGSKWQRIMTMFAGLWSELILCGFATLAWWGLPPGGSVHEISYKIILIAGLAPLLINLNPLVKLDGYYILTELLEISELKELSTEFTTSWFKKNVFQLPVEVPYTPWKRRLLYAPYSFFSAAYGYVLLFVVVQFTYHVAYKYNPQWAFVPALLLAWMVFRSRIRSAARFTYNVYLDKRDLVKARLGSHRTWAFGAALLLLFFLPLWRETVSGRFVLEPVRKSVVRAHVPGTVVGVLAQEGVPVIAGTPLLRLRNLQLDSQLALAESDFDTASDRATQARLRNADYAVLDHERDEFAERMHLLRDQAAQLTLTADISGVVVTPRMQDLLDTYILEGTEVAEVSDISAMRARIYVAETDLRKVQAGSRARIHVYGMFSALEGSVIAISPAVAEIPEGVMEKEQYVGLHAPRYYFVDIEVPNRSSSLKIGMAGDAKVFVRRRSLAAMMGETLASFISRKLW